MNETKSLYSTKEVQEVRQELTTEQANLDLLTGLPIEPKQHCLDHCHSSMLVRGVLARQTNAALGKLERVFTRHLGYWYPYDLPTFLRASADYLDLKEDDRFYHPAWQKKIFTLFNKLSAKQQDSVLHYFHQPKCFNSVQRKAAFKKVVTDKALGYDKIRDVINQEKE